MGGISWKAGWQALWADEGALSRRDHRRALAPALLAALLLRLAVLAFFPQPVAHDALVYDALAVHLLSGQGYVLEPGDLPTATRGPAYPFFLTGLYALFGRRYGAVFVSQALLDLAVVALTYALAWLLYRRRAAATLAAWGYALYLPAALQTGQVMTETVFTLLLMAGVTAYLQGVQGRRAGVWLAGAGAALGLATLTRPAASGMPLVLAAALPWLVGGNPVRGKRAGLRLAAPLLLTAALVLAPWVWRNWQIFGAFIPTSTLGGVNLYISHYALDQDDYLAAHTSEGAKRAIIWTRVIENEPGALNEVQLDALYQQKALALIRQYPLRYLHLALNRSVRLWVNLGYPNEPPSAASWALAALHGALLIVAQMALRERGQAARRAGVLWALLAYYTLFHMAVLAYVRFVFPVMPLVMVLAGRGLGFLVGRPMGEEAHA
ncbi:MAG: hypothetical protein GX605_13895 [Chloroflexi bacterium]|nr:hypothetical protein [Chloroflexota bacterium]